MPYKSTAQQKFFHTPSAKKAGITDNEIGEYDTASKGMNLPPKVGKKDPLKEALGFKKK